MQELMINIPEEVLAKWKQMKAFGDGAKIISKHPELNSTGISRALQKGKCPKSLFDAMIEFYNEKEAEINKSLQQNLNSSL